MVAVARSTVLGYERYHAVHFSPIDTSILDLYQLCVLAVGYALHRPQSGRPPSDS
jgi:hypothetical protein